MTLELSAHHCLIVVPLALRPARRMDPHEAAAGLDVLLESIPLRIVLKRFVIAIGEDQRPILFKVGGGEDLRIVRRVDSEPVGGAKLLNRSNAAGNVVVNIPLAIGRIAPGVNQNLLLRGLRGSAKENRSKQKGNDLHETTIVVPEGRVTRPPYPGRRAERLSGNSSRPPLHKVSARAAPTAWPLY